LVKEPKLVLADEPTANLDSKNAADVIDIMRKMNKELNITFIFLLMIRELWIRPEG